DRNLEKIVSQYWVNFATNGDPNGPGLPPWPAYVPGTDSILHFGKSIMAGPLPNQTYYAFWDRFAVGWKRERGKPCPAIRDRQCRRRQVCETRISQALYHDSSPTMFANKDGR